MATWFDERAYAPEGVDLEALVNPSTSAGGGKKKGKKGKDKKPKVQRGVKQEVVLDPSDPLLVAGKYGPAPRVQSQAVTGKVWTEVGALTAARAGAAVLVRGRVHAVRGKGKSAFLVLREKGCTVQVALFADEEKVSRQMVKWVSAITRESIVDVEGTVVAVENKIEACTQQDVELSGHGCLLISKAKLLPFEIVDASRRLDDKEGAQVAQDTRLDNRFIDLRTPANQAIMRCQSAVGQLFRESLLSKGFVEIHTPKIIPGASESGASVFKLNYMGKTAFLAQSPQLYKQMAVCADLDRVFEIGPVFRAEDSNTHRHLCEFVGLDMEMTIKEHYFEVLDVLGDLFVYMFDGLKNQFAKELEAVNKQYPFAPLRYNTPTTKIPFKEGVQMLQAAGYDQDPLGDLSTEFERKLGELVAEKYGTDFYILYDYPMAIRPFYTMPSPHDPDYSNSYDIFIRGEEIISGAQRIHDPELLVEQVLAKGMELDGLKDYIDSFRYGACPHGGCGVGCERVVMLYLGLNNIRKSSMFPRDPDRLTP